MNQFWYTENILQGYHNPTGDGIDIRMGRQTKKHMLACTGREEWLLLSTQDIRDYFFSSQCQMRVTRVLIRPHSHKLISYLIFD